MLKLKEAATLLGMSESGLRKLVRRNAIKYYQERKGGSIKFRREWIDDHIDGNSHGDGVPQIAPKQPVRRHRKRSAAARNKPVNDHGLRWEDLAV